MADFYSSVLVSFYSIFFFCLVALTGFFAVWSGDWRVRVCAALFVLSWSAGNMMLDSAPRWTVELIISIFTLIALYEIHDRRPGEVLLPWWLLPVFAGEVIFLISHLTLLFFDYLVLWRIMQFVFLVQLLTTLTIAIKRSLHRFTGRAVFQQ